MSKQNQDLAEQLAKLHHLYQQRLQQELPELQLQIDELATSTQWRAEVSELMHRFHRLAGSAGTFGFTELGQAAKSLELVCQNWLNRPTKPNNSEIDLLRTESLQLSFQPQHNPLTQAVTTISLPQKTVLIYLLEDECESARHLCLTLATFGYTVEWFQTLAQLEQALAQQQPDALVLDIELPAETENGLDFINRLGLQHQLPLFVLTCHDDFEHYLQAVRSGALGYFVKPLNTAALEARLQRLIATRERDAFRVLIVDDDLLLAQHYALVLEKAGLRAQILTEPAKIFEGLRKFHPDVILLDVNMPQCTGPELAQLVRLQDEWLGVPIIYLSAETDSERQLEVLIKAGDDFLTKPISDNALVVAIFARAQRARQLAELMTKDSLTGLLQHAHVKERLAAELERSLRHQQQVSVVMLDIDHFKKVNDQYGHLTGDQVITSLANLLKQQLRKTDVIGRYGGEEFLIVLPECAQDQAFLVIDKLRQSFARLPFNAPEGQAFHCTFSAGIAIGSGRMLPDLIIERADQALYQAKSNGRNQVVFSTAPLS